MISLIRRKFVSIFKFLFFIYFLSKYSPTCSEWYVGEFLSCRWVVIQIAIRVELHPLHPGVVQSVVDSRRYTDLVTHRDGVTC